LLLGSETTTKLKLLSNSFKISFHFAFKVSIKKFCYLWNPSFKAHHQNSQDPKERRRSSENVISPLHSTTTVLSIEASWKIRSNNKTQASKQTRNERTHPGN
jgi:hypothetical protein